jgi:hypothetical protein
LPKWVMLKLGGLYYLHVIHITIISFIHLAVCLTTGPKPLPNRSLHIVRSRASSFRCEYPVLSLMSSSSFLHLLRHLPVTSIPPFIFPSNTCCRRQFIRKMWPIQLAFRLLISCRIFLCSLTLINTYLHLLKIYSFKILFKIILYRLLRLKLPALDFCIFIDVFKFYQSMISLFLIQQFLF